MVFGGLPVIENLCIDDILLQYPAVGNIPKRLPRTLNHLKSFELKDICLDMENEVSLVLCLIRSSPNLQKLKIVVWPSTYSSAPVYQESSRLFSWFFEST